MRRQTSGALFLLYMSIGMGAVPACAMEKASDAWNGDAKAYYNRGTESYGKEDYEAAIKDLSAAIRLEPKAPDAYFNRGLSFRRQNKIDEAISDFTKAIELNQTQAGYYFERCNALIVKNNFEGAVADCSDAIRLSPAEAEPYFLRGLAFMLKGSLDEAFADSSKALRIDPDYRDAKRLLFETLLKMETVNSKNPSAISHKPGLENLSRGVFSAEKI